jgi:hypothetical protein
VQRRSGKHAIREKEMETQLIRLKMLFLDELASKYRQAVRRSDLVKAFLSSISGMTAP